MSANTSPHSSATLPPLNHNEPAEAIHIQRIRESQYLDSAQQAIWTAVQNGELDAVNTFLKISDRCVKLWGLALENQKTPHDWVVRVEYANQSEIERSS